MSRAKDVENWKLVSVNMPIELLDDIDAMAKARYMSRTALIIELARQETQKFQREQKEKQDANLNSLGNGGSVQRV